MKRLILLFIFFHCITLNLLAQVHINAPKHFTQNEVYFFNIEASGENVKFPNINKIDSFTVQEAGQSRSISNINGIVTAKYIKRYQLYATRAFTIPPFEIEVDGQQFTTKPVEVQAIKREKTHSQYFEFNIISDKKSLYVGESTLLTLQFKHRRDVKIMDYHLNISSFENFWHKSLEKNRQYKEGDYTVQELDFLLFPQKSGMLSIEPISIEVAVLDMNNAYSFFGNNAKKMRIYSNELKFEVKALPNNVTLVGEFDIQASLDKTTVKAGEAVNYKIEIEGIGNIDDIKDITIEVPDAIIYENKAIIDSKVLNQKYQGKYTKSFSILPNKDIVIRSISLNYFDIKTQSVKTVSTKAFTILVQTNEQTATLPVQLEKKVVPDKKIEKVIIQSSYSDNVLFFILGCVITLLSIGLYFYVINNREKKEQETTLVMAIKKAKTKEEIIICLLPFVDNNKEIQQFVFQLEKENTIALKYSKKELLSIIKKYQIKG